MRHDETKMVNQRTLVSRSIMIFVKSRYPVFTFLFVASNINSITLHYLLFRHLPFNRPFFTNTLYSR